MTIGAVLYPVLIYASFAVAMGIAASALTTYYGQGAAGSGVAELIGYMNGVNYPRFIEISSLITKIFGVILAVSARLCVGKEGPLAHIGAIFGSLVVYVPGMGFDFMRNDAQKRMLISAGSAAGAAAAFGAPIGGALFTYELAKSSEFQTFAMIWRTFITCAFAVLTVDTAESIWFHEPLMGVHSSLTKFGNPHIEQISNIQAMLPAIILGVVGGALGAFFIAVNFRVNAIRKVCLKSKRAKVIETGVWAAVSASVFFIAPYVMSVIKSDNCIVEEGKHLGTESVYQAWCEEGQFDKNAALFWSAEGEVIKNIINWDIDE